MTRSGESSSMRSANNFPFCKQLPDVHADAAARRMREHALIVRRAQLQPVEIQFRPVPTKRGRHMREGDVIAGLPEHPILDFSLVFGRPVERDLHAEQEQQHQNGRPRRPEQQAFDDPAQVHYIRTTSYWSTP